MTGNLNATRLKPVRCLNCGHPLDAASPVFEATTPKPGDITICVQCGNAALFSAELTLEPLDVTKLSLPDLLEIRLAQRALLTIRHERN